LESQDKEYLMAYLSKEDSGKANILLETAQEIFSEMDENNTQIIA
jgi:hypothetical protein